MHGGNNVGVELNRDIIVGMRVQEMLFQVNNYLFLSQSGHKHYFLFIMFISIITMNSGVV